MLFESKHYLILFILFSTKKNILIKEEIGIILNVHKASVLLLELRINKLKNVLMNVMMELKLITIHYILKL